MSFKKKHRAPLLILILCSILLIAIPTTALAAEISNFANFAYVNFFSESECAVSNLNGSGSAVVNGNTITIKATGYAPECGDVEASTTTVKLTAKESISITCTVAAEAKLVPPGEVILNGDGSRTFLLSAGSTVEFTVYANSASEKEGSVTFSKVETKESKVPTDCAAYSYNGNSSSYLDKALENVKSGDTIIVAKSGKIYHSSVETDENYASKTFAFTIPSGVTLLVPYNANNAKITLKALWKANEYIVTLDPKGGAVTPTTVTVIYGEKYPALNDATRTGYSFQGWFNAEENGTEVTTETVVETADKHTLYAYWEANKYNVTLDHNYTGSEDGGIEVEYDKTYEGLTNPTRNGYTFDGWYTAAEGGNKVASNDTVKIERDTTLYAHWNVVSYKVKLIVPEDTTLNGTMVSYDIVNGGMLPTPSNGLFTFKEWKVTKAYGNWNLDDTFTNSISNGFYGSSDESEKQEYVELTAEWGFEVLHDVEDYKYAYNTEATTGGYVMLRVADNLNNPAKEYKFGETSMYYTTDPNYLLNTDKTSYTGVFFLLIGEEYFDSAKNALNAEGEKLLKVADATNRTTLLAEGENKWDINGDSAVNIADANIVYQMVQNGGAYYSYSDGQNGGQLDNKHRLMADLATARDDENNVHRASIMDVNEIVNKINGKTN